MATKNLQYESGRSMVEMLGTLAIIGVLSIGGIAGYKYGMDKYKANQTINDVMLMGVDIITQLSQNRGTPTLSSDWGTKTTAGYDFTVVQNPEDETQYGIQITGVPTSICKQVGDGLKQTVAVYVGNEDYTSDTETDPCDESDSNTMEFYFEKSAIEPECKTNTDCGEGNYCDNGWCFSGSQPEVSKVLDKQCTSTDDCNTEWIMGSYNGAGYETCAYCYNGKCIEQPTVQGYSCTLKNGNIPGQCYAGQCIAKGCNDKNPCQNKDEYCASPNTYSSSECHAFHEGEQGVCVKPDFKYYKIDGYIYYVSSGAMSWWDAVSACEALGHKLGKNLNLISTTEINSSLKSEIQEKTGITDFRIWTSDLGSTQHCSAYIWTFYNNWGYESRRNTNYYNFALCK